VKNLSPGNDIGLKRANNYSPLRSLLYTGDDGKTNVEVGAQNFEPLLRKITKGNHRGLPLLKKQAGGNLKNRLKYICI